MEIPTFTFTRTVLKLVDSQGRVVRSYVIEPFDKFSVEKLPVQDKVALLAYLIESGDYRAVEEVLKLPPYLKLVIPRTMGEPEKVRLRKILMDALNPEYRKSMLIRYLETNRESIISQASSRGVSPSVASSLLNRLIDEIRSVSNLEEVMHYERLDPVDYIVSLASNAVSIRS